MTEYEEMNTNNSKRKRKMQKSGKHVKRIILVAAGAAVIGLMATDCTYQIQEQEQAVLSTFGVPKAVSETGLHFKLPFIQKVYKVNTTIQGFPIGYEESTNETISNEGIMITSDYNFIDVDFYVEYRIADPVKYLYTSQEPEEILKNISQGSIRTVIASYDVDSVLTTGKSEIQSKIKEMIMKKIEEHRQTRSYRMRKRKNRSVSMKQKLKWQNLMPCMRNISKIRR